ncbi:hypothetical protein ACL7TT_00045 [Microbulbifer sp. 2304DJ12-6]|uniref:hypothetical protein n=1 Tax=Microbulbifer sp. 2304DJ12-6 TaxID=3233340 RepID=UPI0039B0B68B
MLRQIAGIAPAGPVFLVAIHPTQAPASAVTTGLSTTDQQRVQTRLRQTEK